MRKNSEIIAQHLAPWWAAAMKNLIYLLLIIALMVAGSAAQAQQSGKIFRIGFLDSSTAAGSAILLETFRQELGKLGWIEGKNITIEYRFSENKGVGLLPELAANLARLNVDVIVATDTPSALAAKNATSGTPIVMANVGDPVVAGLVASLARPGGNVTGNAS
jgi:putative tryptophan/tyrosine transport system substrate-binding protein